MKEEWKDIIGDEKKDGKLGYCYCENDKCENLKCDQDKPEPSTPAMEIVSKEPTQKVEEKQAEQYFPPKPTEVVKIDEKEVGSALPPIQILPAIPPVPEPAPKPFEVTINPPKPSEYENKEKTSTQTIATPIEIKPEPVITDADLGKMTGVDVEKIEPEKIKSADPAQEKPKEI